MNEREMVARAARGDADAFRALVSDYQRLVGHVVFRMIRDAAEREDVCQDVFVRVYRKLHSFRFESKLSTWIARIAYRTCLNHLGKKRMPLTEDVAPGDAVMVDAWARVLTSPADEAEAREVRAFVRERVETLPLAYRTALTLHYLEDMSIPEICDVMDVPAGTVKSHLFRGRALLRQQLLARYAAGELRP
jgi:RNA polymerase sigma-70 factor (ECF subfamily)